jgi:hypothetical protein
MKMITPLTALIGGALVALGTAAESGKQAAKVAMRDAPKHEELAKRLAEFENPVRHLTTTARAPDKREPWKPTSLLERSEFLSFNGVTTLIPKGAILHIPVSFRARICRKDGNRIVNWPDFHRLNRAWIDTVEVSRRQAEAEEPLPEQTLESIRKSPKVIVATFSRGPITVLKAPPEAPDSPAGPPPGGQPLPEQAPDNANISPVTSR